MYLENTDICAHIMISEYLRALFYNYLHWSTMQEWVKDPKLLDGYFCIPGAR